MTVEAHQRKAGDARFASQARSADYSLSLTLVLSGGFLLAVAVRYLLALEIVTPWIMADAAPASYGQPYPRQLGAQVQISTASGWTGDQVLAAGPQ